MHICLFGGAFDPVHLGHQQVAQELLAKNICDEVWFVPVKQHPFGKEIKTNGHREEMLNLILKPNMRVEEYELNHPGKSYSFETLEFLSNKYHQHTFSWVIGSDNLKEFPKWKNFEELLQKYQVFVYPRKGFDFSDAQESMTLLKDFPEIEVSSTQVKQAIAQNQSITGLVDEVVEGYIRAHQLYGTHT